MDYYSSKKYKFIIYKFEIDSLASETTSLLQLIRVNMFVAMTNVSSPSSNLKTEGHPLISGAPFRNHSQAVSSCTETSQRTETCVEDKV